MGLPLASASTPLVSKIDIVKQQNPWLRPENSTAGVAVDNAGTSGQLGIGIPRNPFQNAEPCASGKQVVITFCASTAWDDA